MRDTSRHLRDKIYVFWTLHDICATKIVFLRQFTTFARH